MKEKTWTRKLLVESRLAHLATSTKNGKPHVVPICYVYDRNTIYSSIDEKPKRAKPRQLRRVLNIVENPKVSLVVDQYREDWRKLRYVIVHGSANLVNHGVEHRRAVSLLRKKYRQYRSMRLEERPIIKIKPDNVFTWSASEVQA